LIVDKGIKFIIKKLQSNRFSEKSIEFD